MECRSKHSLLQQHEILNRRRVGILVEDQLMDRPLLDLSLMVELNATGTCYGLMLNGTVGHCGHIA